MKRYTAFISGLAALALISLAPTAFAGIKQESGSFDVTYVKRDFQPISDGHNLMLSESTGTNNGGSLDGFSVSVRETVDLDKGNGSNSGYVIFARGDDLQIVRINGKVTTTMKEGHPNTALAGTWEVIDAKGRLAGTKSEGTFSGYFTAEDKYHIDWKGTSTKPQASAN
jgi:hypothetical protein